MAAGQPISVRVGLALPSKLNYIIDASKIVCPDRLHWAAGDTLEELLFWQKYQLERIFVVEDLITMEIAEIFDRPIPL